MCNLFPEATVPHSWTRASGGFLCYSSILCSFHLTGWCVCVRVSMCFNRCSTESWNWIPIPVQIKGRKTTPGRWLRPPTNSSLLHFSSLGLLLDTEEQEDDSSGAARLSYPLTFLFLFSVWFSSTLFSYLITHGVQSFPKMSFFVWNKMSARNLLNYYRNHNALDLFLKASGKDGWNDLYISRVSHSPCCFSPSLWQLPTSVTQ